MPRLGGESMIGGCDTVMPAPGGPACLDLCVRAVRAVWPQARFEDAESGDKYLDYARIPLGKVQHLLCYRDAASEAAWDADAPTDAGGMVYLILGDHTVTAVTDDPASPDIRGILEGCRTLLWTEICA